MDSALYELSLQDDSDTRPFIDKEVLYVSDQQNGVYNGQIDFDSSNLSNSGRWQAWNEATLELPLVFTLKASQNITAAGAVNSFSFGVKNGYYQFLNKIKAEYNNITVNQTQDFANMMINYKVLTSWSQDDLKKWGTITGVNPDSPASYLYNSAVNEEGLGYINNTIAKPGGLRVFDNFLDITNEGFYERMKINYDQTTGNTGLSGVQVLSKADCNRVGKAYMDDDGGAAAARVWRVFVVATIRLKDISDFFDNMPLVKGGYVKLELSFNSCDVEIPVDHTNDTIGLNSVIMRSGRTNPILFSSAGTSQPNATLVDQFAADGTITLTCGVGKSTDFTGTHPLLNTSRLYVPVYKLDEERELELLQVNRVKEIIYEDYFTKTIIGVGAGETFNQSINNGTRNVQKIIVMPIISKTSNALGGSIESYQSPYDTCPATTAVMGSILNFNVLVGGTNVFRRDKQYDYEMFLDEVSRDNSLDGAVSTGKSSGLISYHDWTYGYRYYVADLSRRPEHEDGDSKGVEVKGTNNTSVTMDYIVFLIYNRSVNIDLSDGSIAEDPTV